eukprot:5738856-Pleurochrysis_carterae.AAC.1
MDLIDQSLWLESPSRGVGGRKGGSEGGNERAGAMSSTFAIYVFENISDECFLEWRHSAI